METCREMQTDRQLTIDLHFMYDSLSRHVDELEKKLAEREMQRVIDLTKEDSPVPVVVPGSIHRALVFAGDPAPAPGLFFVIVLHLLVIFLFAYLGPVRRHFQAEVGVQRREPYQNADGPALPLYDPPPYEE